MYGYGYYQPKPRALTEKEANLRYETLKRKESLVDAMYAAVEREVMAARRPNIPYLTSLEEEVKDRLAPVDARLRVLVNACDQYACAEREANEARRMLGRTNPAKFYVVVDDRTGDEPSTWRGPFSREDADVQAAFERDYWRGHGNYSVRVVSADKKPKAKPRHFSEWSFPSGEEEYFSQRHENPKKNRRNGKATSHAAALAKGQALMAQAQQAFHAGRYPTMSAALKGVARKNRR